MGSLSGNAIKDSYQGLLKTTDNNALSASLKNIEDGSGGSSALSLSTTAVKAETLEINTPAYSSSTNVLVWDNSSKSVGYRTLPVFETVTASVTGATDPRLTITDASGNSSSFTFAGGNGVAVTQSSNTITFAQTKETLKYITAATTLTAADSGKVILLDPKEMSGGTVTLPACEEGLSFKFKFVSSTNTQINIVTSNAASSGTVERFFGKVVVNSTTDDQVAVQKVANTGNSYDYDTLSLESDIATSGGQEGDTIDLFCVTDDSVLMWLVDARLTTTDANPSGVAVISAS